MTILTALQIADNPGIQTIATGPDTDGKYCGHITHGEDRYCRPLLSSNPNFDSAELATAYMDKVVQEINHWHTNEFNKNDQ